MKLTGSYQINLEKQKVWKALNDLEILRKSIPGCESFIKNSIIIPHYGESYYSWITNTIKILNKGKYKLICLEKDTYFVMNESEIKIIGKNNIHIIYKKDHQTFSDGDTLELSILEL